MSYEFTLDNYLNKRGEFYEAALEEACKNVYNAGRRLEIDGPYQGGYKFKWKPIGEVKGNPDETFSTKFRGLKDALEDFYAELSFEVSLNNTVYILEVAPVVCNVIAGEVNKEIVRSGKDHINIEYGTNKVGGTPGTGLSNTKNPLGVGYVAGTASLGQFFNDARSPYMANFQTERLEIHPDRSLLFICSSSPDNDITTGLFKSTNEIKADYLPPDKCFFDPTKFNVENIKKISAVDMLNCAIRVNLVNSNNKVISNATENTVTQIAKYFDISLKTISDEKEKLAATNEIVAEIYRVINTYLDYFTIYYFHEGQTLKSFTDFPPKKTSGGGSGGKMRADNVEEFCYAWWGNPILGIAIGLDILNYTKWEDIDQDWLKYATNVPWNKTGLVENNAKIDYTSEVLYSKRLIPADKNRTRNKKKNNPLQPIGARFPGLSLVALGVNVGNEKVRLSFKEGTIDLHQKGGDNRPKPGITLKHGNSSKRKDAGKVMGAALISEGFPLKLSKMPATEFANEFRKVVDRTTQMDMSDEFDGQNKIVTDQEWCHLHGHGDGGVETYNNFVSGSKHCNTEQLAIETGLRAGRTGRTEGTLKAKITAYKFPSDGKFPMGKWMRYKIYNEGEGTKGKIFDHIYDAQSQSFNYHEFRILEMTVRRVVAEATGKLDEYEAYVQERFETEKKKWTEDTSEEKNDLLEDLLNKLDFKDKYKVSDTVRTTITEKMKTLSLERGQKKSRKVDEIGKVASQPKPRNRGGIDDSSSDEEMDVNNN